MSDHRTMKADRDFWDLHFRLKEQGFEECPAELQKEIVFSCNGKQFKLWYNFVASGRMGLLPANRWWVTSHNWDNGYGFSMPLGDKLNSMVSDDIVQDSDLLVHLGKAVDRIELKTK